MSSLFGTHSCALRVLPLCLKCMSLKGLGGMALAATLETILVESGRSSVGLGETSTTRGKAFLSPKVTTATRLASSVIVTITLLRNARPLNIWWIYIRSPRAMGRTLKARSMKHTSSLMSMREALRPWGPLERDHVRPRLPTRGRLLRVTIR